MIRRPPRWTLVPYSTLSRSARPPRPARPTWRSLPMRRFAMFGLGMFAAVTAFSALAEAQAQDRPLTLRSEEHTSELQSRQYLVCRLLLEKTLSRVMRLRRAI